MFEEEKRRGGMSPSVKTLREGLFYLLFFSTNLWIPMKSYCLFVWCLKWTVTSVFASYIRFLIENEMKFINKIPWYNLKRLMKSKISYKQYLPRRHDLNFLMTTEFPREPLSGVWGKYFWNICVLYLEYLKYLKCLEYLIYLKYIFEKRN